MNDLDSMYYVYKHYLDDKLFYIGKGIHGRAFDFKNRNPDWLKLTENKLNRVRVEIVAYFINEELAYEVEKMIITKYNINSIKLTNYEYNPPNIDLLKECLNKTESNPFIVTENLSYKKIIEVKNEVELWNILSNKKQCNNNVILFIDNRVTKLSNSHSEALLRGFKSLLIISDNKLTSEKIKIDNYNFIAVDVNMIDKLNLNSVNTIIINTPKVLFRNNILLSLTGNFKLLICQSNNKSNKLIAKSIIINEDFINKPLTADCKEKLCENLGLIDNQGRLVKWRGLNNILTYSNYETKDKTLTIDGQKKRVTVIQRKNIL